MGRNLGDEPVTDYLQDIKVDLEEIKNRQLIGEYNLKLYRLSSSNTYDVSFSLASSFVPKRIDLFFSAVNQDFPFFNTPSVLYIDSPIEANKVTNPNDFKIQGNIYFGQPRNIRIPHLIYNLTGSTHDYFLKFYFKSSDVITGTAFAVI